MLPSERCQIAVKVPSGPAVIRGLSALLPGAEMLTGGPKSPPGGRVEAWMISLLPLFRRQTAVVVPSGAVAIWGLEAFWPGAERSTGG